MHLAFTKMIDVSNISGEISVAWQYIQYGHRILIMQNCRSHQFTLLKHQCCFVSRRPRTMSNIHLMFFLFMLRDEKEQSCLRIHSVLLTDYCFDSRNVKREPNATFLADKFILPHGCRNPTKESQPKNVLH